ncbi:MULTISPECIES: NrfD/PsrC family molybdoenzyme membrane anchor subunit [Haloferax]|uniref:Dehydrogenase n=1 Tax=Haloferax marinum TaxID=2666143 RepID=A0A6A8GBC3_9EURY|nr:MULTISPECIES: NrfD/PsrC family molybdoenzyme membrane anchor subunit [Haloferax]KAB1190772.1 dehydrogenase [Haloferax sp. CBA1150]MRW98311.1 dehydrogenase [Haloferax marinum]
MDATGLLWLERGHWGVTTAVYLFFAALGGGAYLTGVAAYALSETGKRRSHVTLARWAFLVALVAVSIAGIAILSHLADPLAGLLFPVTLTNFESWITRGTWILVSLGVFAAVQTLWFCFGELGRDSEGGSAFVRRIAGRLGLDGVADQIADRIRPSGSGFWVVAVLGLVPALGTVYTGFELAAVETVPLWYHPTVLPGLFLASGVAAGIATALALTVAFDEANSRLVLVFTSAVGATLLVSVGLLWLLWTSLGNTPAGIESASKLTEGALYIPVVVLLAGIVVSLVGSPLLAWIGYVRSGPVMTGWVVRVSLVVSLVVGVVATFLIRYVVLLAAVKEPLVAVGV